MTNEEILKRFEFELELGLFNQVNGVDCNYMYDFKICNIREYKIFHDILKNLNYISPTDDNYFVMHYQLITIYNKPKEKQYWYSPYYALDEPYEVNNIPEYMYDYKL